MRLPYFIALLLSPTFAGAAEQVRTLPAFDSVSAKGAINVVVDVGKAQSLVLRGDDKFLAAVETRVENGRLEISFPKNEKNTINIGDGASVVIGIPALRAFHVEGAGKAQLNNIGGDSVEIGFQGAGRLVAGGKVRFLKLNAQGVGDVDTRALQAQRADVNFEGVGKVNVYASERLDANVQGVGSLTYFGNPRVLNKTAEGIGSVSAGK